MNTHITLRSGLVPFLVSGGEVMVGVCRSKDGKDWVFPKGHTDPNDQGHGIITAIREGMEEMGVRCVVIGSPIYHIFPDPIPGRFNKFEIGCELYPAIVEGSVTPSEIRESEFLSMREAYHRLTYISHRIALVTLFTRHRQELVDLAVEVNDDSADIQEG